MEQLDYGMWHCFHSGKRATVLGAAVIVGYSSSWTARTGHQLLGSSARDFDAATDSWLRGNQLEVVYQHTSSWPGYTT